MHAGYFYSAHLLLDVVVGDHLLELVAEGVDVARDLADDRALDVPLVLVVDVHRQVARVGSFHREAGRAVLEAQRRLVRQRQRLHCVCLVQFVLQGCGGLGALHQPLDCGGVQVAVPRVLRPEQHVLQHVVTGNQSSSHDCNINIIMFRTNQASLLFWSLLGLDICHFFVLSLIKLKTISPPALPEPQRLCLP